MVVLEIASEYGYVAAVGIASTFLLAWQGIMVKGLPQISSAQSLIWEHVCLGRKDEEEVQHPVPDHVQQ